MSDNTNPQHTPDEEQRRYYDRYLADEMRASQPARSAGGGGPRRSRGPLIVAGVLAAALLVGGGTFLAVHNSAGSKESSGSSTTASSTSAPSPSSSSSPSGSRTSTSTSATTSMSSSVAPVISGWHSVVGPADRPVIYDIPPNWVTPSPTLIVGFPANHDDQRAMLGHAAANSPPGYCKEQPEAYRAFVTVISAGQRDPGEAGPGTLGDAADLVSRNKDGKGNAKVDNHGSKTIKLHDGTVAVDSSATATFGKGKANASCNPQKEDLRTVVFSNPKGDTYCVLFARDVAPDAPKPADIDKIVSSIRLQK